MREKHPSTKDETWRNKTFQETQNQSATKLIV